MVIAGAVIQKIYFLEQIHSLDPTPRGLNGIWSSWEELGLSADSPTILCINQEIFGGTSSKACGEL